jgi:hypothetical protein
MGYNFFFFGPGPASDLDLPTSASYIAGTTDMYHHT